MEELQNVDIYPTINKIMDGNGDVTYIISSNNVYTSEFIDYEKIPYLMDADREGMKYNTYLDRVIIVSSSEPVAVKCAKYLYDNYRKTFPVRKIYFSDKVDEDDFNNTNDEEACQDFCMEISELRFINLPKCDAIKGLPINIYTDMLESIEAEGIIFGGIDAADESFNDKFDAILSSAFINKYIIITPDMVSNPVITDLRMEHGFKLIKIEDVPDTYYERVLTELLSNTGYSLEKGLTVLEVVNRIMKLRGRKFAEEDMDWMINNAIQRKTASDDEKHVLSMEDFTLNGKLEQSAYDRLSSMPGLDEMKEMVIEQTALLKERRRNEKLGNMHGNMIFYGNPGTGKTTCARLLAEIMGDNGITNASIMEVSRADIIGKYVGTTAAKIAGIFEKARGGVLFVDEAGFFLNTNAGGYVDEAIKEFVRFMENYPDVIVIFAMYEREAEDFLKLDAGLASRISRMIEFKDYSDKELSDIFIHMAENNGYTVGRGAVTHVMEYIRALKKEEFFGNAREVRKILESCIISHSVRVMNNDAKNADVLTGEDIKRGIKRLSQKLDVMKGEIGFR